MSSTPTALCRIDLDPVFGVLFTKDPRTLDEETKQAMFGICANCPLRVACHEWATNDLTFDGIAAGREWRQRSQHQPWHLNSAAQAHRTARIRALNRAGWNDQQIAHEMRITDRTVLRIRHLNGIPAVIARDIKSAERRARNHAYKTHQGALR